LLIVAASISAGASIVAMGLSGKAGAHAGLVIAVPVGFSRARWFYWTHVVGRGPCDRPPEVIVASPADPTKQADAHMTLRDQIKQKQRPLTICLLVGLGLFLVPWLFVPLHQLGLADPWGGGYFGLLMVLAAGGGLLIIIGAIGMQLIRCPKCRGRLEGALSSKERYCRYCGADFDAEA
jgi:hypothetical protein